MELQRPWKGNGDIRSWKGNGDIGPEETHVEQVELGAPVGDGTSIGLSGLWHQWIVIWIWMLQADTEQ